MMTTKSPRIPSQPPRHPIISFGANVWDDEWHTRQHILSRLGRRGWPVVYSNGTYSIWDRARPWRDLLHWSSRFDALDHVTLYRPGSWQTEVPRLTWWCDSLSAAHSWGLRRWSARASTARPIVYVFHPQFWNIVRRLQNAYVVYHADDNFTAMPDWDERMARMQAELVERADLVLASSPGIMRSLPGSGRARAHQMPNGADVVAFEGGSARQCPPDLQNVPHPRIGYIGNLNEKVDFGLIRDLARAQTHWQWVFVGRQIGTDHMSAEVRQALAVCRQLPNVHFLGHRLRRTLPDYVGHMDVNILCYRTHGNGWWRDVYPLKLHEYLAAGKPIVSAALEVVEPYASVLAIAAGRAQWLDRIQQAFTRGGVGSPQDRVAVARKNSWDIRVDKIEAMILAFGNEARKEVR